MTPEELLAIGCETEQFEDYPNDITEYYLAIGTDSRRPFNIAEERISADMHNGTLKTVWLVLRQSSLELPHITTIEQFGQIYTLLTGKAVQP